MLSQMKWNIWEEENQSLNFDPFSQLPLNLDLSRLILHVIPKTNTVYSKSTNPSGWGVIVEEQLYLRHPWVTVSVTLRIEPCDKVLSRQLELQILTGIIIVWTPWPAALWGGCVVKVSIVWGVVLFIPWGGHGTNCCSIHICTWRQK